jgi:hypothetical protein
MVRSVHLVQRENMTPEQIIIGEPTHLQAVTSQRGVLALKYNVKASKNTQVLIIQILPFINPSIFCMSYKGLFCPIQR